MKQFNENIGNIMDKVLQQHTTSVQFETVWNKVPRNEGLIYGIRKAKAIPLIAVITLLCLFLAGFTYYKVFRFIDKTDYAFIDDSRVKGKWETVGFVKKIEDFKSEEKSRKSELPLTSLVFIKDGKMLESVNNEDLTYTPFTWTKDLILDKQEKTAGKYLIKNIDGTEYMFLEWKGGDYIFKGEIPGFYVLKNIDNEDYSNYQVKSTVQDNIDYPFVDDADMKGKWECVDFVQTIDSFNPDKKNWPDFIDLKELVLGANGELTLTMDQQMTSSSIGTWTKGMILINMKERKMASKCEIKDINGTKYMFFEWKNGNYAAPSWYYVLKKAE